MKTAYRIGQIISSAMAVMCAIDGNWEVSLMMGLLTLIMGQEIALLKLEKNR